MKKIINSAAIVLLALTAVLGCKKQESGSQPRAQQRWVILVTRVYEYEDLEKPRTFADTIDVTDWDTGKELLYLADELFEMKNFPDETYGRYYPWQGEDSIDYSYDDEGFLWVNGKLVAGSYYGLSELGEDKIKDVRSICLWYPLSEGDSNPSFNCPDNLNRFPQLSFLDMSVGYYDRREGILDSIRFFPENLMLKIRCNNPTNKNINQLLRLPNLYWLEIRLTRKDEITKRGFMRLARAKQLKQIILLRCPEVSKIDDRTIEKLRERLPDCDIYVGKPRMVTLPPERLTLRQWFFRYVLSIPIIRQIYVALFT